MLDIDRVVRRHDFRRDPVSENVLEPSRFGHSDRELPVCLCLVMKFAEIVQVAESGVATALWAAVVEGDDVIDFCEFGPPSAPGHGAVHPLGGKGLANAVGDRVVDRLRIQWCAGRWIREDACPC